MSYEDLSDEDKILTAIGFVARGSVMPYQLRQFLEANGLYDLITNPTQETVNEHSEGNTG